MSTLPAIMRYIMKAIELLKNNEHEIRKRFGVRKIGIFGSFARGEEKDGSDIDVLVEFQDNYKTFDNYMDLKFSLEDLFVDEMKLDAIVRNFEIIGEAASNIPAEIRGKYPFVEWRKISDFRNVLAHEYFGINYKIMWDIIKNKLPALQKDIQTILKKEK